MLNHIRPKITITHPVVPNAEKAFSLRAIVKYSLKEFFLPLLVLFLCAVYFLFLYVGFGYQPSMQMTFCQWMKGATMPSSEASDKLGPRSVKLCHCSCMAWNISSNGKQFWIPAQKLLPFLPGRRSTEDSHLHCRYHGTEGRVVNSPETVLWTENWWRWISVSFHKHWLSVEFIWQNSAMNYPWEVESNLSLWVKLFLTNHQMAQTASGRNDNCGTANNWLIQDLNSQSFTRRGRIWTRPNCWYFAKSEAKNQQGIYWRNIQGEKLSILKY